MKMLNKLENLNLNQKNQKLNLLNKFQQSNKLKRINKLKEFKKFLLKFQKKVQL